MNSFTAASRAWFVFALIVCLGVLLWHLSQPSTLVDDHASQGFGSSTEREIQAPPLHLLPTAGELAARINAPGQEAPADLQAVNQVFYVYRQAHGENPSGHNEIITAALLGQNASGTIFIPPNSPCIQNGTLVDRWGTPFWFHSITAHVMEIRSAGPDKNLFTADDIVIEPGE
jgi:hypothetical protein